MSELKSSVSLFGFTNRYVSAEYTLDDIFHKTKELGADGLEIVAPQMIQCHPFLTDSWIEKFKDYCARYDLNPTCYSIYVDNGKYKNRFLTEKERIANTVQDMENAKRLGFSIVRSQDALLPETMEKLLPYAEEMGQHLAIELHSPWKPSSPLFQKYEEVFEKYNSDHIGVVMDFSAFTSGAPDSLFHVFPDNVCHKQLLKKISRLFATTEIPVDDLVAMLYEEGGDEVDEMICREKVFEGMLDDTFGTPYNRTKVDYEGFRRLLKYSKYMHGKFNYVNENLEHPGTDFRGLLKIMKEENYEGYICSEYEGHNFDPKLNNEEQLARHIRMCKKIWSEL